MNKRRAISHLRGVITKREYLEADTVLDFTCWDVHAAAGSAARDRYEDLFEFRPIGLGSNQRQLWGKVPEERNSLRILLLGFAIAMISTGDL